MAPMLAPLRSLQPVKGGRLFDLSKAKLSHANYGKGLHMDQKGRLYIGKRGLMVRVLNSIVMRMSGGKASLIDARARSEVRAFQKGVQDSYKELGRVAMQEAKKEHHEVKQLSASYIQDVYRAVHKKQIDAMQVGMPQFRQLEAGMSEKMHRKLLSNRDLINSHIRDVARLASGNHMKPLFAKDMESIAKFVLHHGLGYGDGAKMEGFSAEEQLLWAAHTKNGGWRK